MTTATTNQMRMTQQMTCPAVVAVSDVMFFIVITSTNAAIMKSRLNSYMCERRICEVYSYCAFNVSSRLDMKLSVILVVFWYYISQLFYFFYHIIVLGGSCCAYKFLNWSAFIFASAKMVESGPATVCKTKYDTTTMPTNK